MKFNKIDLTRNKIIKFMRKYIFKNNNLQFTTFLFRYHNH